MLYFCAKKTKCFIPNYDIIIGQEREYKMRMSRDSWVLIAFSSLRRLTDLFVGSFLVAYIMHLAANTVVSVSAFRLLEYIALMGACFFIAHFCKMYNKVFVFGLHLVVYVVLMAMLIYLGDNVLDRLFMIGAMYGLAEALYAFPFDVMTFEKIAPDEMARFISIKSAWRNSVRIIAPTVLGIFITLGSFVDMAKVMLVIVCLEFGLLFLLGRSRHRHPTPIDYRGFVKRVVRFPIVRKMLFAEGLRGLADVLDTTITMYTIYIFYTDLNLGMFTTLFAICTIVVSSVYSHFSQRRLFNFIVHLCVLVLVFGVGVFVVSPGKMTFLMYNFAYATTMHVLSHICDAIMFNVGQSRVVGRQYKYEYVSLREIVLCVGRCVGFVMLMYIGIFGGMELLRWSLLLMCAAQVWAAQISVAISNNLRAR